MISVKPAGHFGRPVPETRLTRYLRQGLPEGPEGPEAVPSWDVDLREIEDEVIAPPDPP